MTACLQGKSITVIRQGRRILDGVDVALRGGELTILVGPNGAGKTTLARTLAGLIRHDGDVVFEGRPITTMRLRERARAIAYLPQGHQFHWPMRVDAIVGLGREPHADMFGQQTDADRIAVAAAMAATSVTDFAQRDITTLSGGEMARVAIARALATDAKVLIADEPVASLDERHRLIVLDLLKAIARKGTAVLAIIHDLALAMRYADRIVLMNAGRIVAQGAPAETLTPEQIAAVFGVVVHRVDTPDGPALISSHPI